MPDIFKDPTKPQRVIPSRERSPMELHHNPPDRPLKTPDNAVRNLPNANGNKVPAKGGG